MYIYYKAYVYTRVLISFMYILRMRLYSIYSYIYIVYIYALFKNTFACDVWVSSGIYWEKHSYKYLFININGNNTGACSFDAFYFHIYDFRVEFKRCHLMQLTWCLRTLSSQAWKACLVYWIRRLTT